MPFPRFQKLPEEKRERLLDIAAQEFAAHGFEDASVNRILERAQMSKGAAYYYFEDKVDLFFTVVQHCIGRLMLIDTDFDTGGLTEANFWPTFAELHRQPLLRSFEQPWLFAAIRAAGHLSPATLEREPLATLARQIQTYVMNFIKKGQELGVIRSDIPDDLIYAWIRSLDGASDQWLLARWKQLERETIGRISDQTVEAMQRVLAPSEQSLF